MNDKPDMLAEIEAHEAWLRQAMPALPQPSLEALKLRVGVAVNEAWLSQSATADLSPDLAAVKAAVRREVVSQKTRGTRWTIWGGGFAAAAAIALTVMVVRPFVANHGAPVQAAASERLAVFVDALAGTDSSWDDLEADLVELEETLADGSRTTWNDDAFDELDGALDSLAGQLGQESS